MEERRSRNLVGRFVNNLSKASGIALPEVMERQGEGARSKSERATARNVCAAVAFFPRFYCVCSATGLIGRATPGGGGGADGD